MPYIQGRHNGRAALLEVAIIDAGRHREYRQSQRPVLEGVKPYIALIDTGATSTMITSRIVRESNLQPVGMLEFFGLDGSTWKPGYLFHVAFYDSAEGCSLKLDDGDQDIVEVANPVARIHVCTRAIMGGEIERLPSFDVLLGMDILTTGELNFASSYHWRFSF